MEFKLGDSERARTIFEGIVDSYPKRLDLWWVYIDQEIRVQNIVGVRALFDRVLATKLSSKKTKSLFKKWLAFEKQHGDDAGAEAVKQRAVSVVAVWVPRSRADLPFVRLRMSSNCKRRSNLKDEKSQNVVVASCRMS